MAVQLLLDSTLTGSIAQGLEEYLVIPEKKDVKLMYSHPEIQELRLEPHTKVLYDLNINSIRLPARINNPLIPYSEDVKKYILSHDELDAKKIHDHHHSNLKILQETFDLLPLEDGIRAKEQTFDINVLKKMSFGKYSMRTDLINVSALEFAKRATQHELGITALTDIPFQPTNVKSSDSLSFLITIHRMRALLGRLNESSYKDYNNPVMNTEEATLHLYKNYTYSYSARCSTYEYCIIVSGGHFKIYHSDTDKWFCGTLTYLDYMFSVSDIMNNLDIIMNCKEYEWAHEFFNLMKKFSSTDCEHNNAMNFMKSMEGFLLNMSDYDEDFAMNWGPILDASYELYKLDKVITGLDYDFKLVMMELHDPNIYCNKDSILQSIIGLCKKLTRTQMQELSSLHKLIFYAEVNDEAGVIKFLKRVHTPRKIDIESVKGITRLAKQLFIISYHKKHKTPPNCLGNTKKIKLLEIKLNRREYNQISSLPLSWWDDIEIFNCMDNKLTNDALEFAKDKGALKKEVRFGPGDSRKELLQVIEQENYILKDFFGQGHFVPKEPKIYLTNHARDPFPTQHPVRLIEKEREQKEEARLFANGELSDKHALSLVTTRMKKALGYFDEQLMTPSDKKRKEIIHLAAQKLRQEEMYSLLLDIEGHNQSMQSTNTSELAEFCGLLFGERGWGNLPDYFSLIDIFHYNEYTDRVILSQGQLGGVEGWLNPLWTLHTTLMMKLLRHMTDIEITDIMVYSDDVNAIIEIKQATEETIRALFNKVVNHCLKFGMVIKLSQTNLSKHRVTMLRQHYSDGIRADSTLKKLISTSGANNPMLVSEEIEVAGICSSIASALELSNHNETCCYLKNYKIGLLTARLPHIILSQDRENSYISSVNLPKNLANLLYSIKDDTSFLIGDRLDSTIQSVINDISRYLGIFPKDIDNRSTRDLLKITIGENQSSYKFIDSADRLLYLQINDKFLQDLLFFWIYLPTTIGGLGGIFHINLILSGHSSGFSKSIHYLHQWIKNFSSDPTFFLGYLELALGVDPTKERNFLETRILTTSWPSDSTITTATTSISQSIESMVKYRTRNKSVKLLMTLKDNKQYLSADLVNIFRDNMHPRVAQFYMENTSGHFLDLLINKIETSSGLLSFIKNLCRLRNSLQRRMMDNILLLSRLSKGTYGKIDNDTDTVMYLLMRRKDMFNKINFIEVDEILYDNRMEIVTGYPHMLTVRKCTPMHYDRGIRVFDTPDVGNEARYKGEFMDDDRMVGNKEEFLAAKLVAVTKWFLSKSGIIGRDTVNIGSMDCVKACNLSLSTLTGQTFFDLQKYSPNETGGEILHRIPNIRFSTITYIRSEQNKSLTYSAELNQRAINDLSLSDSNINFDYMRLRFLLASIIKDSYPCLQSFITRYKLTKLSGISDVQFVTPKPCKFSVIRDYLCYGNLRGHSFSALRFRYMVNSYLTVGEVKDISLIPTLEENESSAYIEADMIEDLIYHYVRELDKEYMSIIPTYIDIRLWYPLMDKLKKLAPKLESLSNNEWLIYLSDRLRDTLTKRRLITTVFKSDTVRLALQNQCIESTKLYYPSDRDFQELSQRYHRILTMDRPDNNLQTKLTKYQVQLRRFDEHREKLGIALIIEYIITLNFHTKIVDGMIFLDADKSLAETSLMDIFHPSILVLIPDLHVKAFVLGVDYLRSKLSTSIGEIRDILNEISNDNIINDIIAPGSLPNLNHHTLLTGDEFIPESAKESDYEMEDIPESAMESFDEIKPLCEFVNKCVISGSHPAIFTSPTGSDSFSAQYGLFRMLIREIDIDKNTKICDLTGGRGDFQYVCRELELTADTFSKNDSFTRVFHHPKVDFSKDYDLTKNESLKFLTNYQFIHIDISFTGGNVLNILDLILWLESNNLGYSIRINSIELIGYISDLLEDLPPYSHRLAFPVSRIMKNYQLYLVGVPGNSSSNYQVNSMKKTVAFRAVALSYARLLNPYNRRLRLYDFEPNSISIYIGNGEGAIALLKQVADRSYEKERLYYSSRYITEVDDGEMISWVPNGFDPGDTLILEQFMENRKLSLGPRYNEFNENHLGNVSSSSVKYHITHLNMLKDPNIYKVDTRYDDLHDFLLEYMRIHHPIAEVRTKCNIVLGVKKFNYTDFLSGRLAVIASIRESKWEVGPKDTIHQVEVQNALKLMMISATNDDYMYGIKYLSSMMSSNTTVRKSYMRTLKCYRLLSTHYEIVHNLIYTGGITIRQIDAIKHDMEVKESRKLKYRTDTHYKIEDFLNYDHQPELVDGALQGLFDDILNWSNHEMAIENDNSDLNKNQFEISEANLKFDIAIDDQVNLMIMRLGLSEANEYGWIDLNDDELPTNWDEL